MFDGECPPIKSGESEERAAALEAFRALRRRELLEQRQAEGVAEQPAERAARHSTFGDGGVRAAT